jgi:6-phosphogluconate dehydrogenase
MKVGFIGLGKMGYNMSKRLLHSHEVVVYDINQKVVEDLSNHKAIKSTSIKDLVSKLDGKKVIWMMLPSGQITDDAILEIKKYLKKGDILIDGGNSYYKDSIRREKELKKENINYLDAGVSGGVWGLKEGYCLMVGGNKEAFDYIKPIL